MIALVPVISFAATRALFSDTASSVSNTFSAAESFGITPTVTPTPGIVINEVSPVGDTDVDWLEIFNNSGSSIDLSGWKIQDNGGTDVLSGSLVVPNNGYAVIVASGSSTVVPGSALKIELDNSTIGGTGGIAAAGDLLRLINPSDVIIDQLSWGTNTDVFNPSATAPTSTNTLRRIPNGTDTDTAGDWQVGSGSIGLSN